jgi:copper chaperone
MDTIDLTIEGMTCEHCLRAVRKRLGETPGVEIEDVRIGSARIRLDTATTSLEDVEEAIADEGYTAFRADGG